MSVSSQVPSYANALDELIERHTLNLLSMLNQRHTLDELGAEIALLSELVHSSERKDHLIKRLLENYLSENERAQIEATLEAQQVRVAANREELLRLHRRSQSLIEQSRALIARAQEQINKEAHNHTGYSIERCSHCQGRQYTIDNPCPACKGKGTVLVSQQTGE
jgi:hypothetical protein